MKKQLIGAIAAWSLAMPAMAGSHLWDVWELFSTADGTIQFIELHNPTSNSGEVALNNKWVRSVSTGMQYTFTANLPPNSTANKYLLLATQSFADLPGAPTPDHIIPENFFDLNGDTIQYWMYGAGADLTYGMGAVPTDGVMSLNRDLSTGVNSPRNFNDESGSVDASQGDVPTVSEWGLIIMAGLLIAVGGLVVSRRQRVAA